MGATPTAYRRKYHRGLSAELKVSPKRPANCYFSPWNHTYFHPAAGKTISSEPFFKGSAVRVRPSTTARRVDAERLPVGFQRRPPFLPAQV